MAKWVEFISYPGESITLPFKADTMAIINTTKYTLAVREGSPEKPASISAATEFFPPDTMVSVPVDASVFGVSLVSPTLTDDIPGLPTTAQIIFLQGELPPTFSSAPLTSLTGTVAAETLLANMPSRDSNSSYTDGPYAVPSGTRSLLLSDIGTALTSISIVGVQTGRVLATVTQTAGSSLNNAREIIVDFLASLDTSVRVQSAQDLGFSGSGWRLMASRQPYTPGRWDIDARQRVNILPVGVTALPVSYSLTRPDFPMLTLIPIANYTGSQFAQISLGGAGPYVTVIVYMPGAAPSGQTIAPRWTELNTGLTFWTAATSIGTGGTIYHYLFGPNLAGGGGSVTERAAVPVMNGARWDMIHSGAGTWNYGVFCYRHW